MCGAQSTTRAERWRSSCWATERMRNAIAMMIGLIACSSSSGATEARSEATVGRDFAYFSSSVETELVDGRLAVGGGVVMVSDFINERYGAEGLIEYRGEHVNAGVEASFGPRQLARGWASLDPHVELQFEISRWTLKTRSGVLLRRIDALARRKAVELDQLQLHLDLDASFDDCWTMGAFALYSFYDPDPTDRSLRGIDLGLAVTLAGRPERWAVGGRIGARLLSWLRAEIGVAGAGYADASGAAIIPRFGLRAGPWRGFTVGASVDVAVKISDESAQEVREIAGLEVEFER